MKRSARFPALWLAVTLGSIAILGFAPQASAGGASCAADAGVRTASKKVKNDPAMTAICQKACATTIAFKESDVVGQPGAKRGDLTRCPVSGVVFKVGFTNPTVAHKGATYRFCCSMCSKEFKAKPAHFVS